MSFVEHFASGSLPSGWGAFASGNASHSYSDSKVTATWTAGAASASGLYYTTPLDLTKRQRWAVCRRTAQNSPHPYLRVVAKTGAPAADTRANYDARTLIRAIDSTQGSRVIQLSYRDTGGTYQHWNNSTFAWATGGIASTPTKTNDDYDIIGFEFDPNGGTPRMRLFVFHVASGASVTEAAGPKLFALTDWVNCSAMEDGSASELYVVVGWPENDFDLAGSYDIEWVAMDDGAVMHGVTNEKSSQGSTYNLKHWSRLGVDGAIVLPDSRTAQLINLAGQAWHANSVQFKSVLRASDGTVYVTYNGKASGAGDSSIGILSGSSLSALTDYASNPVIMAAGTGNLKTLQMSVLIEDFTDPDASRRWKLLVSAFGADSKYRVYLFTATAATGPLTAAWTNEGIFLDADGDDAAEGGNMHLRPVRIDGRFLVLYNAGLGPTTKVKWGLASQLSVGSLIKRGLLFDGVSGDEMTPTSVAARTISGTVPASFVQDMMVLYDADATEDNWGVSRIRKVNAGSVELYHYIPGASTAGRLRGLDAGAISVHDVREHAGEWWLDVSFYQVFNTHATFRAFCEVSGLMRGPALTGPFAVDWFRTPQARWGRNNNERSSENIAWEGAPTRPWLSLDIRSAL